MLLLFMLLLFDNEAKFAVLAEAILFIDDELLFIALLPFKKFERLDVELMKLFEEFEFDDDDGDATPKNLAGE